MAAPDNGRAIVTVLAVLNEKGGVGKTTLARHIAAGAALRDLRVLLIDTDTQGHCSRLLGIGDLPGLYQLLVQHAPWGKVIYEPDAGHWSGREPNVGRLLVLPGDISTRAIVPTHPLMLRERLAELANSVDLIVLDTSPTPVALQTALMLASDYVVYPTQCQDLSLDGLAKTTTHMRALDTEREGFGLDALKLVAVVPTMYEQTLVHGEGLDALVTHFGRRLVWEPFAHRTIWQQCEWQHKTLFAYAPTDPVTADVRRLVDHTLNVMRLREMEQPHA